MPFRASDHHQLSSLPACRNGSHTAPASSMREPVKGGATWGLHATLPPKPQQAPPSTCGVVGGTLLTRNEAAPNPIAISWHRCLSQRGGAPAHNARHNLGETPAAKWGAPCGKHSKEGSRVWRGPVVSVARDVSPPRDRAFYTPRGLHTVTQEVLTFTPSFVH